MYVPRVLQLCTVQYLYAGPCYMTLCTKFKTKFSAQFQLTSLSMVRVYSAPFSAHTRYGDMDREGEMARGETKFH